MKVEQQQVNDNHKWKKNKLVLSLDEIKRMLWYQSLSLFHNYDPFFCFDDLDDFFEEDGFSVLDLDSCFSCFFDDDFCFFEIMGLPDKDSWTV